MPQAQQLGRYQLLDRIAFGGMAEIYRAKTFDSEGRERMVAVKRVLQHLTTDDDFIRMLVDEAKLTAILDHPSVARVYEFSQAGDEFFIAMEYVDGKDVRAILERHRQTKSLIPVEHVAFIIANVADGLHAAHQQHDADGKPMYIVHRDVSPSNILCSYAGDAKLCDFGIAKATLTRVQTRTGVIKGKVKYMSPEQAMGRKLDGRSDLFSLGSVMYEMLTLEAPFQAPTEVELIFAVRDAKKRDVREVRPDVPAALAEILNRVMQRQRTDRYQNGFELARELNGYLERQHTGYRKATLGRYLRMLFKDDIDKDLRQLEGWVLKNNADPSVVGVNLIADAMPADAEYRKFMPASSLSVQIDPSGANDLPPQPTAIFKREEPSDLHGAPTKIVDHKLRSRNDLHAAATLMLEGKNADALRSQIGSLHEQPTKILDKPAEKPPAKPAFMSAATRIAPKNVEPQKTQAPNAKRTNTDTAPDSPMRFDEDNGDPTVRNDKKEPASVEVHPDFSADEDSTSATNPLADADIEEA